MLSDVPANSSASITTASVYLCLCVYLCSTLLPVLDMHTHAHTHTQTYTQEYTKCMKTCARGSLGGTKGHINAATHPCSSAEVPVKPVGLAFVSFSLCYLVSRLLSEQKREMHVAPLIALSAQGMLAPVCVIVTVCLLVVASTTSASWCCLMLYALHIISAHTILK